MALTERCGLAAAVSAAALAIVLSVPSLALAQDDPKIDRSVKFDMAKVRLMAGAPMPASELPHPPANGEMTFVFSNMAPVVYPGWDACPTGWSFTNKEHYLATVSPKERARLMRPENEPELTQKWKASTSGPNGTNVCTNYDKFPERGVQAQVQSKIAYGLNLAGDTGNGAKNPDTCAHETFTSPLGEKNIDNQAYRALGCSRTSRGPDGGDGEVVPAYKGQIATGQYTIVIIVRGVHSLVNDDNVEVILASSNQLPIVDSQQNFIANASYHVAPNARWRNVLHGRIVDGVLTTDGHDVHLLRAKGLRGIKPGDGSDWEWDFAGAKLRLAFRPDGTLEGLLGGYEDPRDILRYAIGGGRGTAQTAGADCAAEWNTLMKLADGGRDPQTGKCTRVSSAFRVTAAPAFVFDHPPENTKSASAQ